VTYFLHLIMRLQITGFKVDQDNLPIINPPTTQAIRHLLYVANPFSGKDFDVIHLRDLVNGNMEAAKKFCMTCGLGHLYDVRDVLCGIDDKRKDPFETCELWITDTAMKNRVIANWGEICLVDGSCI
jgi:hypothetical protein